jgi:hypothetical protein
MTAQQTSVARLVLLLVVMLSAANAQTKPQTDEKSQAQPSSSLPTMDLHRGDVTRFDRPGPVSIASRIKCGPSGDIYASYRSTSSQEIGGNPIRRVSVSSNSVTEYPVPTLSGYRRLARVSFDVSADGTLYALLQAYPQPSGSDSKPDPVYLIVKYKDDGEMDSYFALGEMPGKRIDPTSLAMFGADISLVSGTTIQKNPEGTSQGLFSAIFDRGGTFRARVELLKIATPAKSGDSPDSAPDNGNAVSLASSIESVGSSDGNIYVLQDGHLDVVSPAGSVEQEFELPSPGKKLVPTQMAAAGSGYVFISYDRLAIVNPAHDPDKSPNMLTVVRTQTGEVTLLYRMPLAKDEFSVPACAASLSDFLFLGADEQGRLAVVHYVP